MIARWLQTTINGDTKSVIWLNTDPDSQPDSHTPTPETARSAPGTTTPKERRLKGNRRSLRRTNRK